MYTDCKQVWNSKQEILANARKEEYAKRDASVEREFRKKLAKDLAPPTKENYDRILRTF
jgi:hypothetical protein